MRDICCTWSGAGAAYCRRHVTYMPVRKRLIPQLSRRRHYVRVCHSACLAAVLLQSGAENVTNRSGTSYPTLLEGDERQLENWVAGCAVSNGRVIVGAGSDTPQIACAAIYQYQASGQARITLPALS